MGNSSGKYDFEPELFEEDIKNKKKVQDRFRKDLKEVLYKSYKYKDGTMSHEAKRAVLIEVHKEFIGVD